jgi:Ca2+-binding EF-hand superfamily protein
MTKWILMAAVAFALSVPSAAQAKDDDPKAARAAKMLKKLDKDKDGKISLEEYKAIAKGDDAKETKAAAKFKKMDKNSDGFVTAAELAAGGKKKKAGKKKKDKDADAAK